MSVVKFNINGNWFTRCDKAIHVFDDPTFRQLESNSSVFYNGNWIDIECETDINYEGLLDSVQLGSTWSISFNPELSGTKTLIFKNAGTSLIKTGEAFLQGSTVVNITVRKTDPDALAFDSGTIRIKKNGTTQRTINFSNNENVSYNFYALTNVFPDDIIQVEIAEG